MIIQSKRVWISGDFIPAQIEISGNKIKSILPYGTKKADKDYKNRRITPGFLDIHCHGAYGFDTNDAKPAGLRTWMKNIVKEGVTGVCCTTITQTPDVLKAAVANVAKVKKEGCPGADILGIHFEGPYLDMEYKGAQPPECIAKATVKQFKEYQKVANGLIKIITLAPEHDHDLALTKYCSDNGVVVSMGHSSATFDEALMAVANGATSITHTYNGMSPFNHRKNGLVGTALRLHDLYSEVICDCNHSTPEALNIFFNAKGRNHGIMISDGLMCKGFKAGTKFMFGGHEIVIYPDGSAHLTESKSLAGSTLKINEGLRNLVERAQVPFDTALNACTINPATLLHMDDHIGRICTGYDADLVVLNDNYSVEETYCKGKAQF